MLCYEYWNLFFDFKIKFQRYFRNSYEFALRDGIFTYIFHELKSNYEEENSWEFLTTPI